MTENSSTRLYDNGLKYQKKLLIINVKVLQIYTRSAQEVLRKGREIYVVFLAVMFMSVGHLFQRSKLFIRT